MKILLVEDNEEKLSAIRGFALAALTTDVQIARSYYDAKVSLVKNHYDLVLLDMSIPVYNAADGRNSSVLVYGGEDLLAWAKRRVKGLRVVIVTQFDAFTSADGSPRTFSDMARTLKKDYRDVFVGMVYYSDTQTAWQTELLKLISSEGHAG